MRFSLVALSMFLSSLPLLAAPRPMQNCPNGQCPNVANPSGGIRFQASASLTIPARSVPVPSVVPASYSPGVGIPESQAQPGGVYWRLPNGNLSLTPPGIVSAQPSAVPPLSMGVHIGGFSMSFGVVSLHNRERQSRGLPALVIDPGLSAKAQAQADAQARSGRMFHSGNLAGARAENVAAGQTSDDQVSTDWMNSPGHRTNILNGSFTKIGVGRSGNYWVVQFQ